MKLDVIKKFILQHPPGTLTTYAPGIHDFDDDVAEWPYVKAHTKAVEETKAEEPPPGEPPEVDKKVAKK